MWRTCHESRRFDRWPPAGGPSLSKEPYAMRANRSAKYTTATTATLAPTTTVSSTYDDITSNISVAAVLDAGERIPSSNVRKPQHVRAGFRQLDRHMSEESN
jgi:hypothetical protein